MSRNKAVVILAFGVLFGFSSNTRAILITNTYTFGTTSTDWSRQVNIAQFDLPGTLNHVTITEALDWHAFLSGTNLNSQGITVNQYQTRLTVDDSLNNGSSDTLFSSKVGYNGDGYQLDSHTGHVFSDYYGTNVFSTSYSGSNAGIFDGAGTIPLLVYTMTSTILDITGGAYFQSTQRTESDLNVTVVYDYLPLAIVAVPEPSLGMLLSFGGLLGLTYAGWRRKFSRKP